VVRLWSGSLTSRVNVNNRMCGQQPYYTHNGYAHTKHKLIEWEWSQDRQVLVAPRLRIHRLMFNPLTSRQP
jgi:hypothetical protein